MKAHAPCEEAYDCTFLYGLAGANTPTALCCLEDLDRYSARVLTGTIRTLLWAATKLESGV